MILTINEEEKNSDNFDVKQLLIVGLIALTADLMLPITLYLNEGVLI